MKHILIVFALIAVSFPLFAQQVVTGTDIDGVRDLVDPTITDRILLERNHEQRINIYRWCTLLPAPPADKKEVPFIGEKINYRGKDYLCPARLGCRPDSGYGDDELMAYQSHLLKREITVIAIDLALIIPTYLAARGVRNKWLPTINWAKGLGYLTGINIAGWTLSPYIARVTANLDWTRFSKSSNYIAQIWDVNPSPGLSRYEVGQSIKEMRENLNKSLCELNQWQQRGYFHFLQQ